MASNSLTGHGRWPQQASFRGGSGPDAAGQAGAGGRWLAMVGGTALGIVGLRQPGWGGRMLALGGAGLFLAGALGLRPFGAGPLRAARDPGAWRTPASRRRSQVPERTQAVVTIAAEPGEIFRFWRNFANLPKLMPQLERVDVLSATESRWTARADVPAGAGLNWRCVLDRIDEDRLLTWHTVGETPLPHRASLMLAQAPGDRGTEVRLTLVYRVPAETVAASLGVTPESQAEETLRRLKQRIETGELSTIARQPHGHGSHYRPTDSREAME
ncbi:SRPBCC family protein [Azospirillum picis]|uniref:Membrane protein n=1 Tax=Azospirillum picis TaxID=488438 RepID=A0ABU0MEA7_9PROT|nr:SRPBCC family protein [Azospirillum picis]MBP2297932.1 putative membrane protein [Azospirillum picis]MDQ0531770.1 putative membrane protein [Azospirillum picis]